MAQRHVGFIVHATYEQADQQAYIVLYGRLETGESFIVKKAYAPYFYIRTAHREQACGIVDATYSPTQMTDFDGNPVTRATVVYPGDVRKARERLDAEGIPSYEADIPFDMRFIIDTGIKGYVEIVGTPLPSERVGALFINPSLGPAEPCDIPLRLLSIDIETDERDFGAFESPILSIALASDTYREVLIMGQECEGATTCTDEREMLETVMGRVRSIDPDVIIGWNIIDFDFLYLVKRLEALGMGFDIGRERSQVRLAAESSFIRASRATVRGRKVLDVMHLMRDYFYKFEDYRLETAGQAVLGEGKVELGMPISDLYRSDPGLLARYNLQDAVLVYRIADAKRLIGVSMALSALTGMQLDRVKASIATLDSLYIRAARARGIACPSVGTAKRTAVIGGYVAEPAPGLYEYVLLCDFRSLYPSIIATFNIDPLTFGKGEITAPNGAMFGTGPSILPGTIHGLLEKRAAAKREGMQTRQVAIKIIMNSIFGVLGNPACRFHNAQIANAITSFGRHIIRETSEQIRGMGYEVVYGDTDSVFVVSHATDRADALTRGKDIEAAVNAFYDKYVSTSYGRENKLLLEFERVFDTFLLPRQRHDDRGAKKRYAGMVDGTLKIVGLEYVRRDWTPLAKKYQFTLLMKVFTGGDYRSFTRDYVAALRRGELDGDLVYRKRLRKSISEYTKTTPPHVKAARMMDFAGKETASLVEYVMTKRGPMPLATASRIDYAHYIDKQIRPIADSVLTLVGTSFDAVVASSEQEKITTYMEK